LRNPLDLRRAQGAIVENDFIDPPGKAGASFVGRTHADIAQKASWPCLGNRDAPYQRTVNVQAALAGINDHGVVAPSCSDYWICTMNRLRWRVMTGDFQHDPVVQRLEQPVAGAPWSIGAFQNSHLTLKRVEFDK
jgi:hypothetical protein